MTDLEARRALDRLLEEHSATRSAMAQQEIEIIDLKKERKSLMQAIHGFKAMVEKQSDELARLTGRT